MCISSPIDDKWSTTIEFVIFFILQSVNVGNNLAIFLSVSKQLGKCNQEISKGEYLYCAGGTNMTSDALKPDAETLGHLSNALIAFVAIGMLLTITHVGLLIPNVIKSVQEKDMEIFRESAHPYYKNVLKIHVIFLIVETLFADIPTGSMVMKIIIMLWKRSENNNCWECVADEDLTPSEMSLDVSKEYLTLTLIGIALIALYKGMMPIYLWIGNPFCFPCVPLRLVVVLPGGLISLAMTFGPIMGVVKNELVPISPPDMAKEVNGVSEFFFSLGIIFWAIMFIVVLLRFICWWKMRSSSGDDAGCCL